MSRTIHGYAKKSNRHPLYTKWADIIQRCYNKNNKDYKYYGGRDIIICDKWRHSSGSFIEWALKNGYKKSLILDRIDNDGNYTPDNCRFVTTRQSNINQRCLTSRNTSGYCGVSWHKETQKWLAQIRVLGKSRALGYFDSPRIAACRRDVEAIKNNYPTNF